MNKSLKRFLLLFALICVFVCGVVFVVACNPSDGGNGGTEVTYSVTVTSESDVLDLTTVKAQWMNGEEEASEAIALTADGKASVKLAAGNYTVVLSGYDTEKYESAPASVSADNPNATINITTVKYNVTVMVTVPQGVQLAAEVAVQLYDGTKAVGLPITIRGGVAVVAVPVDGSNYAIGFINLPDYFIAVDAKPVDNLTTITFDLSLATVEYAVNIAVEGDDSHTIADTLTVTFYKGDEAVEGASAVAVKGGVATVSLVAGEYTVKVDGAAAYYVYDDVTVSHSNRTVTITLTANKVTVTADGSEAGTLDFTQLTAVLTNGETEYSGKFNAEGIAVVSAEKSDYTVSVEGAGYACKPVSITGDQNAATVKIGMVATPRQDNETYFELTESGYYLGFSLDIIEQDYGGGYIDYSCEPLSIAFTAPKDGMYVFDWTDEGVDCDSITTYNIPFLERDDSSHIRVILSAEQQYIFRITTYSAVSAGKLDFALTVKQENLPQPGDLYNPYEFDYTPDYSTSWTGVNKINNKTYSQTAKDAYYIFFTDPTWTQPNAGGTYEIIPAQGISVYSVNANTKEESLLSADNLAKFVVDTASVSHLHFVTENADGISFEIKDYVFTGSGAKTNPVEVTQDAEVTFTFDANSQDYLSYAWFKFTATEAGDYLLDSVDFGEGSLYKDSADSEPIQSVNYEEASRIFTLEAGTYYLSILNPGGMGGSVTFKIKKLIPEDMPSGSLFNPISAKTGKNEVGSYNDAESDQFGNSGIDKYYKFTAEKAGLVIVTVGGFTNGPTYFSVTFYNDSKYMNRIDGFSGSTNRWKTGDESSDTYYIEADETIYIYVTVDFYVAESDAERQLYFTIDVLDAAVAVTDGAVNEVTNVTAEQKSAYYSYQVPANTNGEVHVTFGGFTEGTSIYLAVNGNDKGNIYGRCSFYNTEVTDDKSTSLIFGVNTTEEITLYFVLDYKSSSADKIYFTAELFTAEELAAAAAVEGDNTAGKGRATLQSKNYTFTGTGTLSVTTESKAIFSISAGRVDYLNESVEINGTVSFTVYWIGGEGDIKFNVKLTPYTAMQVGANALAAAAEGATVKFAFKPAETGYYTFTASDGAEVTLSLLSGGSLPKIFSANVEVVILVNYTAKEAATLTVAKLAPTAVSAAGDTALSGNVQLIKFTVPEAGMYVLAVKNAKNYTVNTYNEQYDSINVFYLEKDTVVIIAVDGEIAGATLTISKLTATDITELETAITDVTQNEQVKVYKFAPAKDSTYSFAVTGTNVNATVVLYDKDYKLISGNTAPASTTNCVYVVVTYVAEGGAAADVKLVATEKTAIDLSIGMYGPDEYILLGAVTANTAVSFTLEAKFESGESLGQYMLYLDFASDEDGMETIYESSPYIPDSELTYRFTSITITGDDNSTFENMGDGYACMGGDPVSVTIEFTITLSQDVQTLYVGVGGMPMYW